MKSVLFDPAKYYSKDNDGADGTVVVANNGGKGDNSDNESNKLH